MIDRGEILEIASVRRLRPDVVEKDYILGWLLAGIFSHPTLRPAWVFKGGTCLKKCYLETYRFSEDLDFTIEDEQHLDEEVLRGVFSEVSEWMYDQTGIELPPSEQRFEIYRNRRGGLNVEGRVYYRGPLRSRGSLPRIKLDLTADEHLALPPIWRAISHQYSDIANGGMFARCYAFNELFGEKIRALGERSRPRDLYDVVNLFWNEDTHSSASAILSVVKAKCEFKGIPTPSALSLETFRDELAGDWEAMLGHQLPALPPLESFWNAVPGFFDWLQGRVVPVGLEMIPLGEGEEVIPGGSKLSDVRQDTASVIEVIRFSAANRVCVDLEQDKSIHRTEPYSLRKSHDGTLILYACRVDDVDYRPYSIDTIGAVVPTRESFKPRYANELAPSIEPPSMYWEKPDTCGAP